MNEELSCRTARFENTCAKPEKQSLMFEKNWQRKIDENRYVKISYENSLNIILKENEELKSKVLDLMKNKNDEFVASRQLGNRNFSYFSNQPTSLANLNNKTHILEPKQKEVLSNPNVIAHGMLKIGSKSSREPYGTNDMMHNKELEIARKQALLSKDMPLYATLCSLSPPLIENKPKGSRKYKSKNRKKQKLASLDQTSKSPNTDLLFDPGLDTTCSSERPPKNYALKKEPLSLKF